MEASTTITISFLLMLIGGLIGYATYLKSIKKEVKDDTEKDISKKTELDVKLNLLLQNNVEIKTEMSNQFKSFNNKLDDNNERLIRCEESVKSAHKRLDELKKGGN